jgi:hypothetical protein
MGLPSGDRWGACFPARCPMCAADTTFHLLVKMIGLDPVVLGVVCATCPFEVLADSAEERGKLSRAAELWQQQENGELDASAYTAAIEALGSTTLARIIAEARTWTCPACQLENYQNYVTCWNCHYERPLNEDEQSFEYENAPEPDDPELH